MADLNQDDWEEVPNTSDLLTEPQTPAPPASSAPPSQYTPEEQERLKRYMQLESEARRRADDERGQATMSRASAMLGTLGGVTPKSALDTEGAKAADEDAGRIGKLQEYLMKNATERQKEVLKQQNYRSEKDEERSYQLGRDKAKQDFDTKMAAAKTDLERQKASDEYNKKVKLLATEYKLKGDLEANKAENRPDKEPSQPQYQSAGYARRLEQAENDFNELAKEGFKPNSSGRYIANMLPEGLQSDQAQRFNQAKRNFVNAVLRKESGAAISQSEFDSAEKQYFPQPGDSAHVIAQKEANRAQKLAEFKGEAGSAYDKVPLIAVKKPGAPSLGGSDTANAAPSPQQSAPNTGLIKEGGKYFKTAPDGTKKEVVKAFKDNSDGKIHYKFSDGTVE